MANEIPNPESATNCITISSDHPVRDPREGVHMQAVVEINDILAALQPAFEALGLHTETEWVIPDPEEQAYRVPLIRTDGQTLIADDTLCAVSTYLNQMSAALRNPEKLVNETLGPQGTPDRTKAAAQILTVAGNLADAMVKKRDLVVRSAETTPGHERKIKLAPQISSRYRDAREQLRPPRKEKTLVLEPQAAQKMDGPYWLLQDGQIVLSDNREIKAKLESGETPLCVYQVRKRSMVVLELIRIAHEDELPQENQQLFSDGTSAG